MSIKRYTGNSFADVSSRKRWNGAAWVALSFGKRWNGSAWVDLWSNSSSGGGDSEPSSGSGELFSCLKSTVSSPTVNYSANYVITRSGSSASVTLTFKGWLHSSSSHLGSGIKLTVFARLNGGVWGNSVIKSGSAV